MHIRYFATNRDRENLAQDVDRETRIKLQKGGYHWADMEEYMSYYLATTNPSYMPSKAIVTNSDQTIFQNFLSKPSVKRIIIGIHGFNTPLHGALTSFSMLADTLKAVIEKSNGTIKTTLITDPISQKSQLVDDDITAFVGFSWPSDGKLFNYQSDRTEAISSASALANLIGRLRSMNPSTKIYLIAHSMGNFLTCNMLQKLIDREILPLYGDNSTILKPLERRDSNGSATSFFLDRFIMLAPDVERRHITQCSDQPTKDSATNYLGPFYAGMYHLVEEVHHFYSRFDSALKASNIEKEGREVIEDVKDIFINRNPNNLWEQTLGLCPAPSAAPPNIYSYNAVTLTNRNIDHGDYMDAIQIASKIWQIILSAD